jgi:NTP pyrophosphatase (non-canonical NTP hydrolase)
METQKSLNYYKTITKEICKQKGWDNVSVEYLWMFLIEEVGELASAIRRYKKQFPDRKKVNVEGEVMDVLSYLFQLADILNIDLDTAWNNHINTQHK